MITLKKTYETEKFPSVSLAPSFYICWCLSHSGKLLVCYSSGTRVQIPMGPANDRKLL